MSTFNHWWRHSQGKILGGIMIAVGLTLAAAANFLGLRWLFPDIAAAVTFLLLGSLALCVACKDPPEGPR